MIEKFLYSTLTSDIQLTAYIDNKVCPEVFFDPSMQPYICYEIEYDSEYSLYERSLERYTVTLYVFSDDMKEVVEIGRLAENILMGATWDTEDFCVKSITHNTARTDAIQNVDSEQRKNYIYETELYIIAG
jgi:hypothetical protein